MFIKIMLCMYVLALLLYALISQSDLLLPLLLAVGITVAAKMVAQAFNTFTTSILFKQIVYLFFISAGIQYLLQFMQMGKEATQAGFELFKTLNAMPLIASIAAFYRHIMFSGMPPTMPYIKEMMIPKIKPFKKEKTITYYEILNEVVPQYPIFTGV